MTVADPSPRVVTEVFALRPVQFRRISELWGPLQPAFEVRCYSHWEGGRRYERRGKWWRDHLWRWDREEWRELPCSSAWNLYAEIWKRPASRVRLHKKNKKNIQVSFPKGYCVKMIMSYLSARMSICSQLSLNFSLNSSCFNGELSHSRLAFWLQYAKPQRPRCIRACQCWSSQ